MSAPLLVEQRADQVEQALEPYRVAEPMRFVLLLVELAHLWPGCERIEFELERHHARVMVHGVGLTVGRVRRCLDALLGEEGAQAEVQLRACRRLGAALLGAVESLGQRVSVITHAAESARLDLHPEGVLDFRPLSSSREEPCLEFRLPNMSKVQRATLRALIRDDARFGQVEVVLDEKVLSQGPASLEVLEAVPIGNIGYAGWSLRFAAREHGTLVLVAHGVAVEAVELPGLPRSMFAAVDSSALARTRNLASCVRGPDFDHLGEQALAAAPLAPQPGPVLLERDLSTPLRVSSLALGGLAMAGLAAPLGPLVAALSATPLLTAASMLGLSTSTRNHEIACSGPLRIGLVEGVNRTSLPGTRRSIGRARVRVKHPGGRTEVAHLLTTTPLRAGMRVFVRVHPQHPSVVVPAGQVARGAQARNEP